MNPQGTPPSGHRGAPLPGAPVPAIEAGSTAARGRDPIGPATRFECRICWTVYDPALGDEVWQVPPGTPFAELPAHWTCPHCAALQQDFLVIDERL